MPENAFLMIESPAKVLHSNNIYLELIKEKFGLIQTIWTITMFIRSVSSYKLRRSSDYHLINIILAMT